MTPEVKTVAIIVAFVLGGLVIWIISTLTVLGDYRLLFAGGLVGCAIIIIVPVMGLDGEDDEDKQSNDELWHDKQRRIRRSNARRRRENRF